ncbi:MAG: hypothetical protein M1826_003815 [Phylliscum demangeonii]|nr:MAG: hypothetical protein M1826_003815 [Phylliscum demangeonii]
MGLDPPLPAPTDSTSAPGNSVVGTDVATDLSRHTDRTSYSIPDDGSPVTISTRRRRSDRDKDKDRDGRLTRSHHSQTSLLIEYFEGGKGRSSAPARPSVRVKVTPSAARKIKDTSEHIQITETGKARQPSYSKRIALSSRGALDVADDQSRSTTTTEDDSALAASRPPIQVEVMRVDDGSEASARSSPRHARYVQPNPSEISSMPPDSFLEVKARERTPRRRRSRSLERDQALATTAPATTSTTDHLKTPARRRSRSLSRERITQRVIEKIGAKVKGMGAPAPKRLSTSRSGSGTKEHVDPLRSSRRRSSKSRRDDELASAAESSLATHSQLSHTTRSGDQYSVRSTTSKSSLTNPRLLETVEDAIRRLILPELNALKHEQTTQRNRSVYEDRIRDSVPSTASSATRDDSRRRRSTNPPNVKAKGAAREDDRGHATAVGDATRVRRERRTSRGVTGSPPESRYHREGSADTVTDGRVRGKRSKDRHGLAETAASGALTAAALRHHDSRSSVDRADGGKRRSRSRSRSASRAEDVLLLPPMPLSSDVNGSELTRDSILTARTERPPSAASQERGLTVGYAPVMRVTAYSPQTVRQEVAIRHDVASRGEVGPDALHGDSYITRAVEAGLAAAAIAVPVVQRRQHDEEPAPADDGRHHVRPHGRSLSPIPSVASSPGKSAHDTPPRDSFFHSHSAESMSSPSSAARAATTRTRRAQGTITTAAPRDSLLTDETARESASLGDARTPKDAYFTHDDIYRDATHHDPDDGPHLGRVPSGPQILGIGQVPEIRHTPVAASSAVASLHNPSAVDVRFDKGGETSYPTSLSEHPTEADRLTPGYVGSPRRKPVAAGSPLLRNGTATSTGGGGERVPMSASSLPVADDPLPEVGHLLGEDESDISTNPSIIQGPMGGIDHSRRDHWPYDPTPPQPNGPFLDRRATARSYDDGGMDDGLLVGAGTAGAGLGVITEEEKHEHEQGGYTDGVNHDFGARRDSYPGEHVVGAMATALKDEGYISAAPARSSGALTPESRPARRYGEEAFAADDDGDGDGDPFVASRHARHLSANSHGMASPQLYDSATGRGLERIQSADVVALMEHLTVRDAQRNARDTEILVTLVRSAAEMRNSFEDMRKLLAEQEEHLIQSGEQTQKIILHGPRPLPGPGPGPAPAAGLALAARSEDDLPTKRRNVFRRALKGLSMRSSNDLAKIEDMLVQLLGDVEGLKAAQHEPPRPSLTYASYDHLPRPDGPPGARSASVPRSGGSGSGFLSNPSSARAATAAAAAAEHRVSTVAEVDEEMDAREAAAAAVSAYDAMAAAPTPTPYSRHAASVPLDTPPPLLPPPPPPPAAAAAATATATEHARKHKSSSSSSIFPRISRWSETTASTVAKGFRNSGGSSRPKNNDKNQPREVYASGGLGAGAYAARSRSGSELVDSFHDHHVSGVPADDRLRRTSTDSLTPTPTPTPTGTGTRTRTTPHRHHPRRPASPLIPASVVTTTTSTSSSSAASPVHHGRRRVHAPNDDGDDGFDDDDDDADDPKYQAHRDSRNLQHPQPRPGPSHRYQHQLESQARHFAVDHDSAASPLSVSAAPLNAQLNAHPHDEDFDDVYSHSHPPPRPPKIAAAADDDGYDDDEPLVPARPPKIPTSSSTAAPSGAAAAAAAAAAQPLLPQRKPTGPRPRPAAAPLAGS